MNEDQSTGVKPHPSSVNLYFVMIPTHRNPNGGLLDFKWRRRFSRRHDEAIMKSVAVLYGGYTLLPRSEGGWMNDPGIFQVEGMRPFLFTAHHRESADIIADMVCVHYEQLTVMTGIWALDVQFRDKREGLTPTTNAWRRRWLAVR
jgi:hypothetical protein